MRGCLIGRNQVQCGEGGESRAGGQTEGTGTNRGGQETTGRDE